MRTPSLSHTRYAGPQVDAPRRDASEGELVAWVRLGDEAAFQSLFESYYPMLCDFAQSYLRSPELAEELVQTVFLRIWEHRVRWQPTTSVRAYLFGACRNQALGVLKHERIALRAAARARSEAVPLGSGGAAPLPDEAVQAAELAQVLGAAVDALPERRRLVVICRWRHQLSYAEIAQVLEISVKTVEVQMGRALASLRQALVSLAR